MNGTHRNRRTRLVALSLLAGLLVTAGCGTRATYEDRQAARYGVRNAASSSAVGDGTTSPAAADAVYSDGDRHRGRWRSRG